MWDCMPCLRCGIACGCFFTWWSSPCWARSSPTGVTHWCRLACVTHGAWLHAFQGRQDEGAFQRVSARQGCIPHILAGPFRRVSVRQDCIPHVRTRAAVLTCMPCMLCGIACLACVVGLPVGTSSRVFSSEGKFISHRRYPRAGLHALLTVHAFLKYFLMGCFSIS